VADVQVGLGTVIGDEDLTVLERVHRPGVHVEVGVELLHRHPDTPCAQEMSEAGGCEPLAERRGNASGHEDVLCLRHGL
jgi:hypothetical protein